jgi:tripartite-type tricarboxylate transporter receptor subunit TctC
MPRRRWLAGAGAWALLPGAVCAQGRFPQKPITVVVPFAPAGVADITARTVGQAMSALLGQPVIIDNRPGAGGVVATQAVVKAPADGYTLLLMSNANAVSPHLVKRMPFDVVKDLAPITTLGYFDLAITVAADAPYKSLQELVAYAQAHPGKLTIGTISVGSTQHLSAELFKSRTGIEAVIVPYKGSPAVINALRAKEVDVAFEILSPLMPQLQARTVRALAVTGAQRYALLPEVPTATEQGIPHYQVASWNALAAPAGTPAEVIETVRKAARDAVAQPAVAEKLRELGVKPQAGSPAELAQLLAGEIKRWGEVVRAAKIEPE